jgi:hypothetical protein
VVPSRADLVSEPELRDRSDLLRFCCALCAADGDTARRLVDSRKDSIDWPVLIEVAREYRLEMLLYRAVTSHLTGFVSPAAIAVLHSRYADNQARSLKMTTELRHILDRLASEQIPAIAFKGPVFGAQLYGDVALRIYKDLDVLVRQDDVARVTRMMLDEGYRAGMDLSWEISFEREPGSSVDLHWSIAETMHQFPLTADELWARRSTVVLGGAAVPALCAEDTLLTICFNGLTEDWQRFDRIADVAEFMRASAAVDWPKFLDMCRRHGCELLVLLGLHLAKELFLVKFPQPVEVRLRSHRKAIARAGYEIDDFMIFAITSTDRRRGFDSLRFLFRMRERQRERFPYYQAIAYGLFKPKDDDAPWLRTIRRVLYAVLRLPLLGVKHGLIAIGQTNLDEPNRPLDKPPVRTPGKVS